MKLAVLGLWIVCQKNDPDDLIKSHDQRSRMLPIGPGVIIVNRNIESETHIIILDSTKPTGLTV